MLADKVAARMSDGLDVVVARILEVVQADTGHAPKRAATTRWAVPKCLMIKPRPRRDRVGHRAIYLILVDARIEQAALCWRRRAFGRKPARRDQTRPRIRPSRI